MSPCAVGKKQWPALVMGHGRETGGSAIMLRRWGTGQGQRDSRPLGRQKRSGSQAACSGNEMDLGETDIPCVHFSTWAKDLGALCENSF